MFVFQLHLIGAVGHILYDLAPHLNRFFFGHDRPTSLLGDVQDTPLLHNSHDLRNKSEETFHPFQNPLVHGLPNSYRLEYWKRARAPFWPYFFLSLTLGSRVTKPALFRIGLNSGFT